MTGLVGINGFIDIFQNYVCKSDFCSEMHFEISSFILIFKTNMYL